MVKQFLSALQWMLVSLGLIVGFGCQNTLNNQGAGTVIGGITGGLLGSQVGGGTGQVLATVGGAIAGAVVGNSIGHTMDEVDRQKFNHVLETVPSGKTVTWNNPDEEITYTVTPKPAVVKNEGQPCREYTFEANIGGKTKQVYGTACRDAAGDWKVVR